MEKPTVFISYKRDKSDIVNKLEVKIGGRAEIKRDTKEIGAWESITTFMKSIRTQDFAILVISDNYLKSVACMYEVIQLMKEDDWLSKTMIMLAEALQTVTNNAIASLPNFTVSSALSSLGSTTYLSKRKLICS